MLPAQDQRNQSQGRPATEAAESPLHIRTADRGHRAPALLAFAFLTFSLLLLAAASCGKKEDRLDRSQELPPGDLAGTYTLSPAYHEEILTIQPDGKTELRVKKTGETAIRQGLSYRNRFRLIVFLDGDAEPTGIFLLQDREKRWPGRWKGEIRFMELQEQLPKPR